MCFLVSWLVNISFVILFSGDLKDSSGGYLAKMTCLLFSKGIKGRVLAASYFVAIFFTILFIF